MCTHSPWPSDAELLAAALNSAAGAAPDKRWALMYPDPKVEAVAAELGVELDFVTFGPGRWAAHVSEGGVVVFDELVDEDALALSATAWSLREDCSDALDAVAELLAKRDALDKGEDPA